MKIKIYLHNYRFHSESNWKPIYDEIIQCIKDSNLLNHAELIICHKDSSELYEWTTLSKIWSDSQKEDFYILYIHNKGATHLNEITRINCDSWRKYMLHFNVMNWEKCVEKLKDYTAVGVEKYLEPKLHFAGNFFWTKSNYVRILEDPKKFENDRMYAEMWLGSKSEQNDFYCLHHTNSDLYKTNYTENFYKF